MKRIAIVAGLTTLLLVSSSSGLNLHKHRGERASG
jgi:hypothetical protein